MCSCMVPDSTFARSRTSLIRLSRCLPLAKTSVKNCARSSSLTWSEGSSNTSEKPMIALSGVRSSCDMLARNSDLCRLAASICRPLSSISRNSRAFWIAKDRLSRKCFQQLDHLGTKLAGGFSPDNQGADDAVFAQKRNRQAGAKAEARQNLAHARRVNAGLRNIGNLNRLAAGCSAPHHAVAKTRRICPQGDYQFLFHMVRRAQQELFGRFVVFVNRSAVGAAQLHRVGDDTGEHGFKIQSRAHRLADLAERFQFSHRPNQLAGALLQFLQQTHVLDGDHGLIGEGGDQIDLAVAKTACIHSEDDNDTDRNAFSRAKAQPSIARKVRQSAPTSVIFRIRLEVGDVNYTALEHDPAGNRLPSGARRIALDEVK